MTHDKKVATLKYLFIFSLPSILSSLLEPIAGVIDTAMVGQINTEWLAALAISVTIFNSFTWVFNFLVHASTQTISKSFVTKNYSDITSKIKISLFVALGLGLFSTTLLYFSREVLFLFTGAKKELIPLIESYFIIRLCGHPFTLLYTTLISILRGLSKVKFCFYIIFITSFLNILISWFLLFHLKYGLEGAAIGTVASNVFGALMAFLYLLKDKKVRDCFFIKSKIELDYLFNFGKNSINIFGRSLFLTISFYFSTKMSSQIGLESLAAHQVLLQIWLFASFLIDGLAISGNILGAKYLEEKKYTLLKLIFNKLLLLGAIIGLLFTLIYYFLGDNILSLFTHDPEVLFKISGVWFLIVITQIPNALAFVYDGILFGLEFFAYLRKHMIIGVLLIFLPFSVLVYYQKNLVFIWVGLSLLSLYRGVTGYFGVKRKLKEFL